MIRYTETVRVLKNEALTEDIFLLDLQTDKIAEEARPGQFVMVTCRDESRLLPRPISICTSDIQRGIITLVIRRCGKGTAEFARLAAGDSLQVLGPLGNGFPTEKAEGRRALLVGGGVGIPPLLYLAESLPCEKDIILGFRNADTFLTEHFALLGNVHLATEDGSLGTKGNVLDCIRQEQIEGGIIYACGPIPMLRALKAFAQEKNLPCYLSLEERMACGIGACLGCVCRASSPDPHFGTETRRVCADGPVFEAGDILL